MAVKLLIFFITIPGSFFAVNVQVSDVQAQVRRPAPDGVAPNQIYTSVSTSRQVFSDWQYVPGKSDVKTITGDYPAVYGWELAGIESGLESNLDGVPFDKMKNFIQQGYERGGVITMSWHLGNLLTGGDAWDTTNGAVAAVLVTGARHDLYKGYLDRLASFMLDIKGKKGELIPVLFRPFHELTGDWFWWGKGACSPPEFKALWKFTVNYLRDTKGVHNLLYVYNTAFFLTKKDFLERYAGNAYADIISFDAYQLDDPLLSNDFITDVDNRLGILEQVAAEKNKIVALAESGYETIPYAAWWTKCLWKAIASHNISYVLVWRDAGLIDNDHWHYYVPKKGDVSTAGAGLPTCADSLLISPLIQTCQVQ